MGWEYVMVKESSFKRGERNTAIQMQGRRVFEENRIQIGDGKNDDEATGKEKTGASKIIEEKVMKELLSRSILSESFQPIKFGSAIQAFEELKEEFGRIECRDLEPRKCILSFESLRIGAEDQVQILTPHYTLVKQLLQRNLTVEEEKQREEEEEKGEEELMAKEEKQREERSVMLLLL
ncbi:hypothetical protein PIB30_083963 [Stylosanthes scabra]|uniref:Uncharacterized protein n=1 Tax=Stylosanthes scabra TaxID=79078 RepID=A0ABU6XQQ3_9FABA|nr:hypothetical protein [Stylosanthes scabra]